MLALCKRRPRCGRPALQHDRDHPTGVPFPALQPDDDAQAAAGRVGRREVAGEPLVRHVRVVLQRRVGFDEVDGPAVSASDGRGGRRVGTRVLTQGCLFIFSNCCGSRWPTTLRPVTSAPAAHRWSPALSPLAATIAVSVTAVATFVVGEPLTRRRIAT